MYEDYSQVPLQGTKYQKKRDVTKGAQAKVIQAVRSGSTLFNIQEQQYFAVKCFSRQDILKKETPNVITDCQKILRETFNHFKLDHENIVKFIEVFENQNYLCVVLEWLGGGDLSEYIKQWPFNRFPEPLAKQYFIQIIQGLSYLHQMQMVNRDIKLQNVGLDLTRQKAKLIDLGFSKDLADGGICETRLGTPYYVAPEILTQKSDYDGAKTDVWSCGVLLYKIVFGRFPFQSRFGLQQDQALIEVYRQILHSNPVFESVGVSYPCIDLISRMLHKDPLRRISTQQVLEHEWVGLHMQLQDNSNGHLGSYLIQNLQRTISRPYQQQSYEEVQTVVCNFIKNTFEQKGILMPVQVLLQ